jgi:hypothetical protein
MAITQQRLKPQIGTPLNRANSITNGLIGCWAFNLGDGRIHNVHNGVFSTNAGPVWNPRGMYFSSGTSIDGTISTTPNQYTLFAAGNRASGGAITNVLDDDNFTTRVHQLRFNASDQANLIVFNTAGSNFQITGGSLVTGEFSLIATVSGSGGMNLYLNGVSVGTNTATGTVQSLLTAQRFAISKAGFQPFTGTLYLVGIWNRALSSAEAWQLHNDPYASLFLLPKQRVIAPQVAGGRTTKNTRSVPLGVEVGMNWRGH